MEEKFKEILENSGYRFYNSGGGTLTLDGYTSQDDLLELMENVWNLAINTAANNADADYNVVGMPTIDIPDIEVYVLKNSILKFLIK